MASQVLAFLLEANAVSVRSFLALLQIRDRLRLTRPASLSRIV
jgi:hypothetical protein